MGNSPCKKEEIIFPRDVYETIDEFDIISRINFPNEGLGIFDKEKEEIGSIHKIDISDYVKVIFPVDKKDITFISEVIQKQKYSAVLSCVSETYHFNAKIMECEYGIKIFIDVRTIKEIGENFKITHGKQKIKFEGYIDA